MSISALNSQTTQPLLNSLSAGLETNGLSQTKAKSVIGEIKAVITTADKSKTDIAGSDSIKESIKAQITSDVEKGLITQEEANIITASLDEFTATPAQNQTPAGSDGDGDRDGSPAGGDGGGGTETSSTEVSAVETSTSNSGWTTKTTTYTDDTEKTEHTYNATDDKTIAQSGQDNTLNNVLEKNGGNTNAMAYLASILTTPRLNIIA